MSAVKIKILNTGRSVLVSVDGKQAYTSANTADVEQFHIWKLLQLLGVENVEIEMRAIHGVKDA